MRIGGRPRLNSAVGGALARHARNGVSALWPLPCQRDRRLDKGPTTEKRAPGRSLRCPLVREILAPPPRDPTISDRKRPRPWDLFRAMKSRMRWRSRSATRPMTTCQATSLSSGGRPESARRRPFPRKHRLHPPPPAIPGRQSKCAPRATGRRFARWFRDRPAAGQAIEPEFPLCSWWDGNRLASYCHDAAGVARCVRPLASVFERQGDARAVGANLAVLNGHIQLHHLRDAEIAQGARRRLDGSSSASAHDFVLVPMTSTTL